MLRLRRRLQRIMGEPDAAAAAAPLDACRAQCRLIQRTPTAGTGLHLTFPPFPTGGSEADRPRVSARMPRSDSDFTLSACRTVSFGGGDSLLRAEKTGVTSRRSRRLMGKLSRLREGCGPTLSSIGNGAQIRP